MSTVAITYRRNPQYSEHTPHEPRLFATIDLSRYGVSTKITDLPIYFRQLDKPVGPVRVVYSTHVAGLLVECGNLESLVAVLDRYIGALVRFERLPEYVFHMGSNAWPIYRLPGQLVTRYPGGPVFSAPNIGELRIWLADHFRRLGRIQDREALGILYLSPTDLQLYPPSFTLRYPGAAEIPVFPTTNGQGEQLLAPVDSLSIAVPMNAGAGIFDLYQEVGKYLVRRGWLADPYDMTVRKLAAHLWSHARVTLRPYAQTLSYHTEVKGKLCRWEIPVFTNGRNPSAGSGRYLVAAQVTRLHGPAEGDPASPEDQRVKARQVDRLENVSLYLGPDIRALRLRLGEELYRQGAVNSPNALRIVSAQSEKPASMLDCLLQAPVYL